MARILIVDDALIMRNILRGMLETQGHEIVATAKNGAEALQLFSKLKPDLVTMDILMEGGDGLVCLEKIMQQNPDAKVIMVSATGNDEAVNKARSLGAVGYITKPFKIEGLLEQTQKILA
jgi:two-component system chemotaxis response regulator CheY